MTDTEPRRSPIGIYRKSDVLALIGVSATTLWRMVKSGDFPTSFRISPGLVGWDAADVHLWIEERRHRSKTKQAGRSRASDPHRS